MRVSVSVNFTVHYNASRNFFVVLQKLFPFYCIGNEISHHHFFRMAREAEVGEVVHSLRSTIYSRCFGNDSKVTINHYYSLKGECCVAKFYPLKFPLGSSMIMKS